jgi:putative transposase
MGQGTTLFQQVQAFLPRRVFQRIVADERGDHKVHFVDCWSHFLCLLYAQLTQRTSLRDIEAAVAPRQVFLQQFGLRSGRRCSVARANAQRPAEVAATFFRRLVVRCQAVAPGHSLPIRRRFYSLDASVVDVCATLFKWAYWSSAQSGIKLHLMLDHSGSIPVFARVTAAREHEMRIARTEVSVPPGSVVCFDRGYSNFVWFKMLTDAGCVFVTRYKTLTRFKVVKERVPSRTQGVLRDQIVRLTGKHGRENYPGSLRYIEYQDPQTNKVLVFLTNQLSWADTTICKIYKARWQIETFFKWIKQNLKIKTFYGRSFNAVCWQLYTALCLYLLLAFLKFMHRWSWSLRYTQRILTSHLFEKTDLARLLYGQYQFQT